MITIMLYCIVLIAANNEFNQIENFYHSFEFDQHAQIGEKAPPFRTL